MKKKFRPIFWRILERYKPQLTRYTGQQGILTITVEVKGLILLLLRSCWKHKFLKKRQTFQWKKVFVVFSPGLSSVIDLKGQFVRVHKVISQLLWKLKDHFCNTWAVVENTIFRKKCILSSEEKVLVNFLAQSRVWQTSVNTLYGSTKYCDKYSGS